MKAAVVSPPPVKASAADSGEVRHVKGIASDVVLDSRAGEAIKVYRHQPLIAALYRVMFQAPFPYVSNHAALHAAKHRRLIAGLVTRYTLGRDVVAPVIRVEKRPDGRYEFVSALIEGRAPADKKRALAFLHEVTDAFIESGLPTWQVSPHNPRSLGNLMETADGDYRIIDLESNVVTPMVPVSELIGAAKTTHLPPFDDIDVPRLLTFISTNWDDIVRDLGEEGARQLSRSVARYVWYERLWQANEPRIWSRALRVVVRTLDVPSHIRALGRRLAAWRAGSEAAADRWVRAGIARWRTEGVVTAAEADEAEGHLESGPTLATLTHLGAQMAMSVPLRFPLGSAARFLWTGGFRARAEIRALLRRAPDEETRAARRIHSLPVLFVAGVPGVGAAAYVLAAPLRENRVLMGVTLDQGLRLAPFGLYTRLHLGSVTADLARDGEATPGLLDIRANYRHFAGGVAKLAGHLTVLMAVFSLAAVVLAAGGAYYAATGSLSPFGEFGAISTIKLGAGLVAGALGVAYYRNFWRGSEAERRVGAAGTLFWLGGGLALVWLAADDYFRIHERVIDLLSVIPLVEHLNNLVVIVYIVLAVIWVRLFAREVWREEGTFALLSIGAAFSVVVAGADVLLPEGNDWTVIEEVAHFAAIASVLSAFAIKYREIRTRG